ncbi:MAG: hypothetical protein JXA18_03450 [Chitinispirillaceae bacterium]|nr:hypothetical protein [Chitinispirillaceae bacterium]
MALADIIKTALDRMQYIAKTETVIGAPIVAGEVTLIPVSRISIGFAAGGAGKDDKSGNGAGTGGGITITPVAFIVVTGEKVQVQPVTPSDPIMSKIMSLAPDAVNVVANYLKNRGKKEKKGKRDAAKKTESDNPSSS